MLNLLLPSNPAGAVRGLSILQLISLAGTTRNRVKSLLPTSVRSSRAVYKFTTKPPGKPWTSAWSPAVLRPEQVIRTCPCWCALRATQGKMCVL